MAPLSIQSYEAINCVDMAFTLIPLPLQQHGIYLLAINWCSILLTNLFYILATIFAFITAASAKTQGLVPSLR